MYDIVMLHLVAFPQLVHTTNAVPLDQAGEPVQACWVDGTESMLVRSNGIDDCHVDGTELRIAIPI